MRSFFMNLTRKNPISSSWVKEKLFGSPDSDGEVSENMNEVFFYDPYEKKVGLRMSVNAASAIEAFKKLKRALTEARLSCNDLEKGMSDVMRHMGRRSRI